MVGQVPPEIKEEINLSFAISNKIDAFMRAAFPRSSSPTR